MKQLIINLLSGSDKASSNRLIGILSFLIMVVLITLSLFIYDVDVEIFKTSISYLFYLIIISLGYKGLEKTIGFFKKSDSKNDEDED
ncbi:hypothetical protein [Carboxylicivirga sp. M1479]|uniref:hypothetical protein n=1 Tax=Carboxylicivirga sp. M1479 TaxID=2594476 RepID=UPI001178AFE5|nr:hypothetical protein [Carboxylicivirga sp. M1479]TRX71500.1 hypothetical protein FNN09_05895 [Carboxylicivirga sp. M1479]